MTTASVAVQPARRRLLGQRPGFGRKGLGVLGIVAAVVLGLAVLIGIFGVWLAPYDPFLPDLSKAWDPRSAAHPLGFDGQGRDVLSRLLTGARVSLLGPLGLTALAMAAGAVIGVASAWLRGPADRFMSAALDILFAFPAILLAILAAAVFGAGILAATLALAAAYVPYIARVLRSAALRERSQSYVEALEVQGVSGLKICLFHIVPNLRNLIVAQATLMFGWAMVDLAAVSFLGLGSPPPTAEWGFMISENQHGIVQGYALPSLSAAACIVIVVIAVNILGERLLAQADD